MNLEWAPIITLIFRNRKEKPSGRDYQRQYWWYTTGWIWPQGFLTVSKYVAQRVYSHIVVQPISRNLHVCKTQTSVPIKQLLNPFLPYLPISATDILTFCFYEFGLWHFIEAGSYNICLLVTSLFGFAWCPQSSSNVVTWVERPSMVVFCLWAIVNNITVNKVYK